MLDRKLDLKYLVKYNSPDLSGFHSRVPFRTSSTFVYKDLESACLSAMLLQLKTQAQGYSQESYFFTVELLNGGQVKSLFNTKNIHTPTMNESLSLDRFIVSGISCSRQDPSEGRERMLSLLRPWQAMESLNMDFRYFSQTILNRYSKMKNTKELKEGYFIFPEKGERHCIGPFDSPESMLLSVEEMMLRTRDHQHRVQAHSM